MLLFSKIRDISFTAFNYSSEKLYSFANKVNPKTEKSIINKEISEKLIQALFLLPDPPWQIKFRKRKFPIRLTMENEESEYVPILSEFIPNFMIKTKIHITMPNPY